MWAPDRERAVARLQRALGEAEVTGIPTTLPLLRDIAAEERFGAGRYNTAYLQERAEHLPALAPERAA